MPQKAATDMDWKLSLAEQLGALPPKWDVLQRYAPLHVIVRSQVLLPLLEHFSLGRTLLACREDGQGRMAKMPAALPLEDGCCWHGLQRIKLLGCLMGRRTRRTETVHPLFDLTTFCWARRGSLCDWVSPCRT